MWKFIIVCVLLNYLIYVLANCIEAKNVVKTSNGCFEGELRKNYLAFEGIRYAEPPLGENRFEPPKPYADTWEGVRNATQIGPMCIQTNFFNGNKLEGDEDCLFLNVYIPAVNSGNEVKNLPVLVHIHGGGFTSGDGGFYGHKHLMKGGKFIYVSFNYRLGALGFLSTNCLVVPGNMGLKDQVLVLKWVQENIRAFGGNPDSVTLSGFSAGGAAVHLHYMSPMSTGLLHRGISHSGCALNEWAVVDKPLDGTRSLAKNLNCSHESHKEMINCLKLKKAADIVKQEGYYAAVKEYEHENAFITDTPLHYLKKGKIQKLPWLVSATKDDGAFQIAPEYPNETFWKTLNEDWNHYSAKIFQFALENSEITDGVAAKLKQHYLNGAPLTKKNALQFGKMISDRFLFYGITESIAFQGKLAPVYFYLYKFKLSIGLTKLTSTTNENLGVIHGDDVLLIYNTPAHAGDFKYTKDEEQMTKELLEMYETFSIGEVPKFYDSVLTRSVDKLEYMDIFGPNTIMTGKTEPLFDMDFWREIKNDLEEE